MRFADLIAQSAERLAGIETRENGKLLREMRGQLQAVPDWLYYFGGLADKIEGRVIPLDRQSVLNYTLREPVGVVGAIVAWNSPILTTIMKIAPILAAGNTVVVKPSEHASAGVAEALLLAEEAGFPPGVINFVLGGAPVGTDLVAHPDVARITFTGGSAAGKQIATAAGARLARVTLELGGKSANIIFPDANLDAAEAGVIAGIFAAAGQTCIAGSRVMVHESIYEEMLDRIAHRTTAIAVGDPTDDGVQMGPLATLPQLARVERSVMEAHEDGDRIVAGGKRVLVPGFEGGLFHAPTLIEPKSPDSRVAREEIFGPVLAILPFRSDEEVVELANASAYGLAAGVWTSDVRRAHTIARRLQAGTVWLNTYRAIAFNSPFGGYKESGLGRENGIEAVDEFLQTKSVWCELDDAANDPFTLRT